MLVLKDRSGVDKLPPDTTALHISFRPSRKLIKRILERCPNLKKVYLAEFKAKTVDQEVVKMLTSRGVEVSIEEIRGRPIEYSRRVVEEALRLREAGMSVRAIARILGVPKSVVHYWIVHAKATKTREELVA